VEETLDYLASLEEKGARKSDLIGFRSSESIKELKNVISISTSMSVILMQYDLYHIALEVLKKASQSDSKLLKLGSQSDKLWVGRLHIFTNLSFLYLRLGDVDSSLKFASEAQSFLLALENFQSQIHEDSKIGTDLVTFMVLWLIKKSKQASAYLDSAARTVNTIIKGTPTKLNKNDIQNLYGLIVSSLAALSVKMGGESSKAIELCQKCLKEFEGSAQITKLISSIISDLPSCTSEIDNDLEFSPELKDFTDKNYEFPEISDEILNNPLEYQEDWLISKLFQNLLLESAFYPIVSPNTPALKKEELEFEQAKTKLLDLIEEPKVEEKRHASSVPRKNYSRVSPKRTTASVLKSRAPSKHWWQNQQFMERVFVSSRNTSNIRRKKNRETQNLPPVEPHLKDIYAAKLSPRRSVVRKREGKKRVQNDHMMLEFNPALSGESEKVTLVPINPGK
jgi:hypothetical protein